MVSWIDCDIYSGTEYVVLFNKNVGFEKVAWLLIIENEVLDG